MHLPGDFVEVVCHVERLEGEVVVPLHESRRHWCCLGVGDILELSKVARLLPAVVECATVLVEIELRTGYVLYLVVERGVVLLAAEAVCEVGRNGESLPLNGSTEVAFDLCTGVAYNYLVIEIIVESICAVLLNEYFLAAGRLDAGRAYGPDSVGVGAVVIALGGGIFADFVEFFETSVEFVEFDVLMAYCGTDIPCQSVLEIAENVIG